MVLLLNNIGTLLVGRLVEPVLLLIEVTGLALTIHV